MFDIWVDLIIKVMNLATFIEVFVAKWFGLRFSLSIDMTLKCVLFGRSHLDNLSVQTLLWLYSLQCKHVPRGKCEPILVLISAELRRVFISGSLLKACQALIWVFACFYLQRTKPGPLKLGLDMFRKTVGTLVKKKIHQTLTFSFHDLSIWS